MSREKTFPIDDAGALTCDIDALVDTRLLCQANSGGGKSYLVRRVLEQTHGRVQQLVLDPEGEFATLRERFDYVHAAPTGGDTVAHPRSAALLAERLLELGVSAILDLYELQAHDRIRFVRLFLEALINAPKKLWHPAIVVVDEAHVFAPQAGQAESAGAVIDLASRGRKRGFCAVLATQRLAKLHKDAAAELNNKLVGRTTLDVDLARASDELGFAKARWPELRELPPGRFFATGPAFSARGVVAVQVGRVLTTHPKAGARIAAKAPPATSTIRALLPKLSDLPAEAEQRQKTVDELRADVKRLERELKAKPAAPVPPAPKRVEVPAITPDLRKRIEGAVDSAKKLDARLDAKIVAVNAISSELTKAAGGLFALRDELCRALQHPIAAPAAMPSTRLGTAATRVVPARPAPQRTAPPQVQADASSVRGGEREILTVIAQYDGGATVEQLSVMTGYKRSSRNTYLQRLRVAGLIAQSGDRYMATEAGIAALGSDFEPLPTGDELQAYWLAKLPEGEAVLLREVIAVWPSPIARDSVGEAAGYKRSSRNSYLQRLSARQLVVPMRDGHVIASDTLFDGGARG